jgi:hypothetical protein
MVGNSASGGVTRLKRCCQHGAAGHPRPPPWNLRKGHMFQNPGSAPELATVIASFLPNNKMYRKVPARVAEDHHEFGIVLRDLVQKFSKTYSRVCSIRPRTVRATQAPERQMSALSEAIGLNLGQFPSDAPRDCFVIPSWRKVAPTYDAAVCRVAYALGRRYGLTRQGILGKKNRPRIEPHPKWKALLYPIDPSSLDEASVIRVGYATELKSGLTHVQMCPRFRNHNMFPLGAFATICLLLSSGLVLRPAGLIQCVGDVLWEVDGTLSASVVGISMAYDSCVSFCGATTEDRVSPATHLSEFYVGIRT